MKELRRFGTTLCHDENYEHSSSCDERNFRLWSPVHKWVRVEILGMALDPSLKGNEKTRKMTTGIFE